MKITEAHLIKMSKWIIIISCLIVFISSYFASKISFDYDYAKYFPKDSDAKDFFENYQKTFGSDNDFILIGIVNNNGVFNKEFLSKVKTLGDSIQTNKSVQFIISPTHNLNYTKLAGFNGIINKPYIQSDLNNLYQDSIFIRQAPKIYGNIFSEKLPAISIFIQTKNNLAKAPSDKLLKDLNLWSTQLNFDQCHIAGRVVAQSYYIQKMITETGLFIITSVILVILLLWLSFKNLWGIVIPLLTVIFAIITSIAVMQIAGKSFDLLMIMLPTIIFVVGMSDLVHFLSKYLDELRNGKSKIIALIHAYKEIALATFLTSITTAIGFFSLVSADIIPIKEFGIYSGISVFIAYIFAFTFLPAVYVLLPQPILLKQKPNVFNWSKILTRLFIWNIKNQKVIVSFYIVLILFCVFAVSKLKVNNYLLEDLNENDPVRQNFTFFEQNFAGVRPFELKISALNGTKILDFENAIDIEKIEYYLSKNYTKNGVGFMLSPIEPLKMAYYIKHKNNIEYYCLPRKEKKYNSLNNQLLSIHNKFSGSLSLTNNLLSKDSISGRISGKIEDIGGYAIKYENEKLYNFIKDSIQNNNLSLQLTGTAVLIDKNNESLAKQLLLGLLFALIMIGIIMALVFKSIKMVIISIIPNIIPLLSIGGLMYILNFDIKISTTLFFTLAFGIAVDDTIHLLSKFKLELNKGYNYFYAIKRSYISSGKAIIITSIIICGGFFTLIASNFTSIYLMGLFVSFALLIAVIADLTILPLIILKWFKSKN
jgi:predicted RND superfamily exporter protein